MIRPIGDNLVLRVLTQQLGMIGSLHMPEVGSLACKTGCECLVLAVGRDVEHVRPGDTVHLAVYDQHPAGTEVLYHGEKLIIIRERDVNGILNSRLAS